MHSCHFFFFKQKTAYEMRISDWSSDVCSSDLLHHVVARSVHLRRRINSVGVPVARERWRGRVARRQIRTALSGHILHSSGRHVLRGTMAHFGMLGRAVGIGRKRHVMVYRSHVGGLLVGSSRSEEHTSELQSLMRISYAVFCLKKKIETKKKS